MRRAPRRNNTPNIFNETEYSMSSIFCSRESNQAYTEHAEHESEDYVSLRSFNKSQIETEKAEKKYNTFQSSGKRSISIQNFCIQCEKYAGIIEKLTFQKKKAEDKVLNTEKHLKQYDDLLFMKQKRLEEQQRTLHSELDSLAKEKQRYLDMRQEIEEEQERIKHESEAIEYERNELESQFELINQQKREIQLLIEEYEEKKFEIKMLNETNKAFSLDYQETVLISRENEIQQLLEETYISKIESDEKSHNKISKIQNSLEEKHLKLKKRKFELKRYEEALLQAKDKMIAEHRVNSQKLKHELNLVKVSAKKLEIERKELADFKDSLIRDKEDLERVRAIEHLKENQIFPSDDSQSCSDIKSHVNRDRRKPSSTTVELDTTKQEQVIFNSDKALIQQSQDDYLLKNQLNEYREANKALRLQFESIGIEYKKLEDESKRNIKVMKYKLEESEKIILALQGKVQRLENEPETRIIKDAARERIGSNISNEICSLAQHSLDKDNASMEEDKSNMQLERIEEMDKDLCILEALNNMLQNHCDEQNSKIFDLKRSESILKMKVLELENIINIEGEKLKSELEMSIRRSNRHETSNLTLTEKINRLETENYDYFNQCQELSMEKEKFLKISESLHNRLCEIDVSPMSSDSQRTNNSFSIKIRDMQEELESKLRDLVIREEKLSIFERNLNQERTSVEQAAEYIKTINEELIIQRASMSEQVENITKERIKIANLLKMQDEKSQMLSLKEQELVQLMQKLDEREKLILIKDSVSVKS